MVHAVRGDMSEIPRSGSASGSGKRPARLEMEVVSKRGRVVELERPDAPASSSNIASTSSTTPSAKSFPTPPSSPSSPLAPPLLRLGSLTQLSPSSNLKPKAKTPTIPQPIPFTTRIFLKPLPPSMEEDGLRRFITPFTSRLITNTSVRSGASGQIGFCDILADEKEVNRIIETLNGTRPFRRGRLPLTVQRAVRPSVVPLDSTRVCLKGLPLDLPAKCLLDYLFNVNDQSPVKDLIVTPTRRNSFAHFNVKKSEVDLLMKRVNGTTPFANKRVPLLLLSEEGRIRRGIEGKERTSGDDIEESEPEEGEIQVVAGQAKKALRDQPPLSSPLTTTKSPSFSPTNLVRLRLSNLPPNLEFHEFEPLLKGRKAHRVWFSSATPDSTSIYFDVSRDDVDPLICELDGLSSPFNPLMRLRLDYAIPAPDNDDVWSKKVSVDRDVEQPVADPILDYGCDTLTRCDVETGRKRSSSVAQIQSLLEMDSLGFEESDDEGSSSESEDDGEDEGWEGLIRAHRIKRQRRLPPKSTNEGRSDVGVGEEVCQ